MAADDIEVCNDFVNYRSTTRSYKSRMSFDEQFIYSYAMELAFRTTLNGKRFIIVNGDGAPSSTTRKHQYTLRGALTRSAHAYIPFSQLRVIRAQLDEIEVLATTEATVKTTEYTNKNGKRALKVKHFLGETLFRAGKHLYVCGLDRNDDPDKRMFYMCRLPASHKPKTVDEALEGLRPSDVPKGSPRQGEWFFVPQPVVDLPTEAKRVPIKWDSPSKQRKVIANLEADRSTRHIAQEMCLTRGEVFVRGTIKDDEHDTLKLGKVWHRVVRNLAVEGWRYVAEKGARVD